ncbi:GSCFA domain-containing protein [Hoylesella buccalis]|uniref:GSCFA domain-containing protein n=1 Tax=Hoylesella buccalis TaxID=28127 RepID=UPI0021559F25|nr:GSCFA domain-containing protein [Hoylesella buccalis]
MDSSDRFYKEDMLHPSDQAVAYIWERFSDAFFSQETKLFLADWQPVKAALVHRPFHPDSETYQSFIRQTQERIKELENKWGVNLTDQA